MLRQQGVEDSVQLDAASLPSLVDTLRGEVARLQTKLGELHGTDTVALRRLATSLAQHVSALASDLSGLETRVAGFETRFYEPGWVAAEASTIVVTAGVAMTAHHIISREPTAPFWLRIAPFLCGAGYALAHAGFGVEKRAVGVAARNALRRARLREQVRTLEERVRIMTALCSNSTAGGQRTEPVVGVPIDPQSDATAAAQAAATAAGEEERVRSRAEAATQTHAAPGGNSAATQTHHEGVDVAPNDAAPPVSTPAQASGAAVNAA